MSERFYFSVGELPAGRHYAVRMTEQDFKRAKRFLDDFGYRAIHEQEVPAALAPYALDVCEEFMHGKRNADDTAHALATLEQRTIAAEPKPIPTMIYAAARAAH